jgi:hypothetical protein
MAPTPAKAGTPAEIAAQLTPLIAADPITVAVVLAGYFRAVRETNPGEMNGLKPGVDPLRVELEKWRRAYLEAARAADGADDPVAVLLAAGAALVTGED